MSAAGSRPTDSASSGPVRGAQVALAVRRVLEQLPEPRQVALRWRDVRVGLDAVDPQRLALATGQPAVRRRARDDDVVAGPDVEGAEDRLDPRGAPLDEQALVADPVAVQGRRRAGDDVRDADVAVAEHEAPAP